MGVSDDLAEAWIERWEVEAARRGIAAGGPGVLGPGAGLDRRDARGLTYGSGRGGRARVR